MKNGNLNSAKKYKIISFAIAAFIILPSLSNAADITREIQVEFGGETAAQKEARLQDERLEAYQKANPTLAPTGSTGVAPAPTKLPTTNAPGTKSGGTQIISIPNPLGSIKTIPELLGRLVDWLIFIASVAILPLMIIYGAYQMLTAGGNPEGVTSARHTITWAVIGYALLLISKGAEMIIRDILTRGA